MLGGEWQGFEVAAAALEQLANDFTRDEVLAGALIKAAKPVVTDMRDNEPRLPPAPDMADSLAAGYSPEESGPGDVAVKIGPRKRHPHGFLIRLKELGTSREPANGVMRSTWDQHQGSYTQRFVSAITPEFARALQRAVAFARAHAAMPRSAFSRIQRATTKGEFLAALRDWAPGDGD